MMNALEDKKKIRGTNLEALVIYDPDDNGLVYRRCKKAGKNWTNQTSFNEQSGLKQKLYSVVILLKLQPSD